MFYVCAALTLPTPTNPHLSIVEVSTCDLWDSLPSMLCSLVSVSVSLLESVVVHLFLSAAESVLCSLYRQSPVSLFLLSGGEHTAVFTCKSIVSIKVSVGPGRSSTSLWVITRPWTLPRPLNVPAEPSSAHLLLVVFLRTIRQCHYIVDVKLL